MKLRASCFAKASEPAPLGTQRTRLTLAPPTVSALLDADAVAAGEAGREPFAVDLYLDVLDRVGG